MRQFSGKPERNMLFEELKTMRNHDRNEKCGSYRSIVWGCGQVDLTEGATRGGIGCCEHVYESSRLIRDREFLDQFSGSFPLK
jgi:hypothetical protein